MIENKIGNTVRHLRKSRGLTLKDLSNLTGVSTSYLSEIERSSSSASLITIAKIANALGVSMDSIVNRSVDGTFGQRLKEMRKKLDMTQQDFEKFIGIDKVRVCRYEKGLCNPDFKTLKQIALKSGISIDTLIGNSKNEELLDDKFDVSHQLNIITGTLESCEDAYFNGKSISDDMRLLILSNVKSLHNMLEFIYEDKPINEVMIIE